MPPPIQPSSAATAATGATTGSEFGSGLGRDDFLLLLVTQLRYQDPLNPLQAQDFASQLAEFTAMEQQLRTNELLEAQADRADDQEIEARASMAVGLLGRTVITEGNRLELSEDSNRAAWIGSDGAAVFRVELLDDAGAVVHTVRHEVMSEGVHRVDFGDAAAELPDGTYTVRVEVEAGDEARPLASQMVRGVRFDPTGPVLLAAGSEIPFSDVLEITLNP